MMARRESRRLAVRALAAALLGGLGAPAGALERVAPGHAPDQVRLDPAQSRAFLAWMTRIVREQVQRGPSPRWQHRDCAGLVRFAVNEALAVHDAKWMHANGIATDTRLPPELDLTPAQAGLRNRWVQTGGTVGAFVSALALVQHNSRPLGDDINRAQPGDLLFYDHGDAQHLMVWMGSWIAYHTGSITPHDNGLRSVGLRQLMNWKDTRWQPATSNPNFAGVYRLLFLS